MALGKIMVYVVHKLAIYLNLKTSSDTTPGSRRVYMQALEGLIGLLPLFNLVKN